MKVQIHHQQPEGYVPPGLIHVANIEFEGQDIERALDYAWKHSNNIGGSWSKGPWLGEANADYSANPDFCENVEVLVELPVYQGKQYGLRSSMVGDVFVVERVSSREAFKVASFGFEPCELPA